MTINNNLVKELVKGIDWNENDGVDSLLAVCRNIGFLVSLGYRDYIINIEELGRVISPALWDALFKELRRDLDQEVSMFQAWAVLNAQGLYIFIHNLPEDLRDPLWEEVEALRHYIESIWLDEGGIWEIQNAVKDFQLSRVDMFDLVEEAARSPIRFMLNRHLAAVSQGKGAPAYELGFFSNGPVSVTLDVINGRVCIDAVGEMRINGQPLAVKRKKKYMYCAIPEFLKVVEDSPLKVEFKPTDFDEFIPLKRC